MLGKRSRQVAVALAGAVVLVGGITASAGADPSPQTSCSGTAPDVQGHFSLDCVSVIPYPSPTTVTVPVPVPTTITETVTSPVPTTVTKTVTQTVTASSSPSPTSSTPAPTTSAPSPSSTAAGLCMPQPSRCGWPDATNTGVPAGTVLTVRQGDWTITTAGTVINGYDIRGCVYVRANNVVIRNSRIQCNGFSGIAIDNPITGVLIEDVDVVMSGLGQHGIQWRGYTARRVHIANGSDCFSANQDVLIEDSFCDIPGQAGQDAAANGGPHVDGIQETGSASNVTIRHNTIRNPFIVVSAIIMNGGQTNIRIVDNLMAGGGYTVYCPSRAGALAAFSGNVISRMYYPRGGSYGPTTGCPAAGWRWDA